MKDRRTVSLLCGIDPDEFQIYTSSEGICSDVWGCQRVLLLWAILKPAWDSLGFHLKNPLITLKDRLIILLEANKIAYKITIGDWEGTTKDFMDNTPSPKEIEEAKRSGNFCVIGI